MRGTITKKAVDQLQPKATLWDDKTRGFYCQAGTRFKSYGVFRWFQGRKRRWVLGKHGDLTPDQARREAQRIVAEIALGRDPYPAQPKGGMSVADLCDKFLEQYVVRLKPNSRKDYERQIRMRVLPAWGTKSISALTRADVMELHNSMAGTPYVANHTKRIISAMFNFAKDHGYYTGENPASRIKQFKEVPRTRYLSQGEIERLLGVLDTYHNQRIADLVRLLLLIGTRKGELLSLRWEHVDLERGVLNLPDSKTGAKVVILNPDAQAVFKRLGRGDFGGYVWPGDRGSITAPALDWHWQRVRQQAGLQGVRLHDLRRSFASVCASNGVQLQVVGALLGHKDLKSTQRYAYLYDETLRDAAAVVGKAINGGGTKRD